MTLHRHPLGQSGQPVLRTLKLAALALSIALQACSTAPRGTAVATARPQPTLSSSSSATPTVKPGPRGGAYYLDDGPPDNILVDLDALPDAEPRLEPLNRFANNPYSVLGQNFTPDTSLKPYKVDGTASWYGRKFNGKRTSSGEVYDMLTMTAAHPTLPIPCYARVTNLDNGRTVIVKVNDRGPFHKNRVMDLSFAAAYKLGYASQGSANVRVELITPEEIAAWPGRPATTTDAPAGATTIVAAALPPETPMLATALPAALPGDATPARPPAPARAALATDKSVYLQIGAFRSKDNAESLRNRVMQVSLLASESVNIVSREGLFRLHVGPYDNEQAARQIADKLQSSLSMATMLVR